MPDLKVIESEGLLTPQQAADYLNVKLSTVYNWTMRGMLRVCKLGGRLNRYRKSDLERFIADNMSHTHKAD